MHRRYPPALWFALALVAAGPARGGDHSYRVADPAYEAECASCHIAYPPRLLPARSWDAVMAGLERHFGVDASLDPAVAAEVTRFLHANAGRDRDPGRAPARRITETRWFLHEHDEVPARVWKQASVKSRANCAACHEGAARGNYNERGVRLPQ